jgi:glycosyltransferase involved in cell wall biosynthesis
MNGSRICVMQIVSNLDIGGAQEVVRTLAENLEKVGCQSVVVTFKDGPLRENIEHLGIPVEILPQRQHGITALPQFIRDMLRTRRALFELVKKYNVDVIQTHLLRSLDFLALSLRLQSKVQIFWTFHNARFDLREEHLAKHKWLFKPKRWGYHVLYSVCTRGVNRLIAVSEEVKTSIMKTLPSIPQKKIIAIPNSVDVQRYSKYRERTILRRNLGLAERHQVAAVVATFKEQKGHRYLLDALPEVLKNFPNLVVLFIGDGELKAALQNRTLELGLKNNVLFLGNRQDVPALLAASDLFILPSLWEGLPMALIEAMASGLPVIATQVSGTSQVMIHEETGLLVKPGNSSELAHAIKELLSNTSLSVQMGNAARRRVEVHFGAQKQAQAHLDLFINEMKPFTRLNHQHARR